MRKCETLARVDMLEQMLLRLDERLSTVQEKVAKLEKKLASKHSKQYTGTVNEMQKKGGEARAKKLSPERREQIAKAAAAARWKKQ